MRQAHDGSQVPALILKIGQYPLHSGGVAAVRTLGRSGVPVYVTTEDALTPAAVSRYCTGRFRWRTTGHEDPADLVGGLPRHRAPDRPPRRAHPGRRRGRGAHRRARRTSCPATSCSRASSPGCPASWPASTSSLACPGARRARPGVGLLSSAEDLAAFAAAAPVPGGSQERRTVGPPPGSRGGPGTTVLRSAEELTALAASAGPRRRSSCRTTSRTRPPRDSRILEY